MAELTRLETDGSLPIHTYGHCAFQPSRVLAGFAFMVLQVRRRELVASSDPLRDSEAEETFLTPAGYPSDV